MIGIGGCGEGNGHEASGGTDNDTDAWADVSFHFQNGQAIISMEGSTARQLETVGLAPNASTLPGGFFDASLVGSSISRTEVELATEAARRHRPIEPAAGLGESHGSDAIARVLTDQPGSPAS